MLETDLSIAPVPFAYDACILNIMTIGLYPQILCLVTVLWSLTIIDNS